MKNKHVKLISLLLCLTFLVGCNDDDKETFKGSISVDSSLLKYSDAGGEQTLGITVPNGVEWTILTDNASTINWYKLEKVRGVGNAQVKISVVSNISEDNRTAVLTVIGKNTENQEVVTILQGSSYIVVDKKDVIFESDAETQSLKIIADDNAMWFIELDADNTWCTIDAASGKGNATVNISASENTSETPRTAKLKINGTQNSTLVNISQDLDISPYLDPLLLHYALTPENKGGLGLDKKGNGKLYATVAAGVKLFNLDPAWNTTYENNGKFTSLKGIHYFTALEELYLHKNQVKELDLRKNIKLIKLSCEINQVTSLNLTGLDKLTDLKFGQNKLESLDLSTNTSLRLIDCSWSPAGFKTLDLSGANFGILKFFEAKGDGPSETIYLPKGFNSTDIPSNWIVPSTVVFKEKP